MAGEPPLQRQGPEAVADRDAAIGMFKLVRLRRRQQVEDRAAAGAGTGEAVVDQDLPDAGLFVLGVRREDMGEAVALAVKGQVDADRGIVDR